jgi:signal transduction histidine kinase
MVNEFLDITQFQLGGDVVSLKPGTQVDSIIEEIVKELEFETNKKGIYLKFEKPKEKYPIQADQQKLKAALFNLFDNAVKYTQKGGVTIKMENLDKNVKITVKDTGIGISPEGLTNMFNKTFERGERARKEFVTGRGVGLYISNQIIKAHNGKLWAESEGEGKGSTFHIELPIENNK